MTCKTGKTNTGLVAGIVIAVAIILSIVSVVRYDTTGEKGSGLSAEYQYDISEYAKIPPEMILYQQVGNAIPTGLKASRSIAYKEGIYVSGDTKVVKIDGAGKIEKEIALESAPTCLAVDDGGVVIVGSNDTITILDKTGTKRTQFVVPQKNAILSSIVLNEGLLLCADAANGLIYRYDLQGELVNIIGEKDPQKEDHTGFVIPSPYFDIAMASDGLLRVVDPGRHVIVAFTLDGHREWTWGKASPRVDGFSGCCNPVNMAILPDGSFVTAEKGLVRVKVYDAEGQFVGVVAGPDQLEWQGPLQVCDTPEQCQSRGFDVAVDETGRIYVLDTVKNVVRIFEKKQ
ncbi:MAG TPA: hypothetical protein PKB02_00260 [Anaerohalosphaeraceae bacterium]|nr:hypothetical protein [Anaerohalosphaeraceae bacterium]